MNWTELAFLLCIFSALFICSPGNSVNSKCIAVASVALSRLAVLCPALCGVVLPRSRRLELPSDTSPPAAAAGETRRAGPAGPLPARLHPLPDGAAAPLHEPRRRPPSAQL